MAKVEICSWRRSGRDALDKDINLTLLLQQQWLTNEQSRLILQQVGPKLKWGLNPLMHPSPSPLFGLSASP